MNAPPLVRRSDLRLRPDPARVIVRPFHPGQEALIQGISRAESVVERVLAMSDDEVSAALADVLASFAQRHADLRSVFRAHAAFVAHRLSPKAGADPLSEDRVDLIGACLTHEYAVEAAALFNPSIVEHPDQTGCADGEVRILMSLRAVGEGHVSSVEFRTGVVGPGDAIRIATPGRHLSTGTTTPIAMSADVLRDLLGQQGDAVAAEGILRLLPPTFTPAELEGLLTSSARDNPVRGGEGLLDRIRRLSSATYRLEFPRDTDVSERVIVPTSELESQGIEDVRFTPFTDSDGQVAYLGTYTAFDGTQVAPHLLRTSDFATFEAGPMVGPAAQNKGMALFPRRVDGDVWGLSRWDRENISVARSPDGVGWGEAEIVLTPARPWDLIQLGACSSPVETAAGWLVLIHGVGPMRVYRIGALLLDLADPTRVLGVLDEPLLSPAEDEREGYVPNVVYSCGALVHGSTLVVPYGCSDSSIRFAFIDLPGLLARLHPAHA